MGVRVDGRGSDCAGSVPPVRAGQRAMTTEQPQPAIKAPTVEFRDIDPLQDYYNDGEGGRYSVARLIDAAKDLPVFEVPLAALDLSAKPWEGYNLANLAFHVRKCIRANLDEPILLDWDGAIADGRHRVLAAIAKGRRTIKARRLMWKLGPCGKTSDD